MFRYLNDKGKMILTNNTIYCIELLDVANIIFEQYKCKFSITNKMLRKILCYIILNFVTNDKVVAKAVYSGID